MTFLTAVQWTFLSVTFLLVTIHYIYFTESVYLRLFRVLCLCWQLAAEGILFSGCSVRDHVLKVCDRDILQTACGNFTKFTI